MESISRRLSCGQIAVILALEIAGGSGTISDIIKLTNLKEGYVRNILLSLKKLNLVIPIRESGLGFLLTGSLALGERRVVYALTKDLREIVEEHPEIVEEVQHYEPSIKTPDDLIEYIENLKEKYKDIFERD